MNEGDQELQDLYRDTLVDYYRDATYKGTLPDADITSDGVNPTCGDEVHLTIRREGDTLKAIRYAGHGCVISQSSTAMMCEALEGKDIETAEKLGQTFREMMKSRNSIEELPDALEELKCLDGVRKFPIRVKCALLAWITFLQGVEKVS